MYCHTSHIHILAYAKRHVMSVPISLVFFHLMHSLVAIALLLVLNTNSRQYPRRVKVSHLN